MGAVGAGVQRHVVGAGFSRPVVLTGLVMLPMRHATRRALEPTLLEQFRPDAICAHDERLLSEPGQLRMRELPIERHA